MKKNKRVTLVIIFTILIIAGLLDLKYEGLGYQLLPTTIQSYLNDIL